MKKKIVAALAAALLACALPTAAFAWESPTGDVRDTITVESASGVPVKVAVAANGTGALTVTDVSAGTADAARATNAPSASELEAKGYTEVASFKIEASGDVQPPYNFSYNLGSEYANADVTVYVDHEGKADNEVIQKTASSDGTITFTTDALSVHTIAAKKSDSAAATTDKSSKSPQTGMNTALVGGVTAAAAVAAAGVTVALKKARD